MIFFSNIFSSKVTCLILTSSIFTPSTSSVLHFWTSPWHFLGVTLIGSTRCVYCAFNLFFLMYHCYDLFYIVNVKLRKIFTLCLDYWFNKFTIDFDIMFRYFFCTDSLNFDLLMILIRLVSTWLRNLLLMLFLRDSFLKI